VFLDNELNVNGGVCQVCVTGKWKDSDTSCNACSPPAPPKESNPPATEVDCTAKHHDSGQPLTFRDGARGRLRGQYKRCSAGQWLQSEPTKEQLCTAK
jgi:hypothetical protein